MALGQTEGERWARELLDRLRAEGFTPGAWIRFLGASFARAAEVRRRRPEAVRQSRLWGLTGLAAAAPFGAGPAVSWIGWWAMLEWHLGMLETPAGRPRPLRAADALTLWRLWAAPIVRRHPAPALVLAGMATDLADGALARRAGPTRLGRDFDSTADAAFLLAALAGAVDRGGLSGWLPAMERGRLVLGAALNLGLYFGRSVRPVPVGNRELAAVLAAAGAVLASSGRRRAAEPLLAAAIGYRSLIRLR